MSLVLEIANLAKTYPNGVRALRDVSITIPTGMFGLLGPNGAGKSTLMRTIATLQEPDGGTITMGDLDVLKPLTQPHKNSAGEVASLHIGNMGKQDTSGCR